MGGGVLSKKLLQLEGLAVLTVSIYLYANSEYSWMLFMVLFFVPDLSMLGYMFNVNVGSVTYNTFHTYSAAIGSIILGIFLSYDMFVSIGLIWSAHIGFDRMQGHGLKYPTHFKDTHLNRV